MQVLSQMNSSQCLLSLNSEYMKEEFIRIVSDICRQLSLKPLEDLENIFGKISSEKGKVIGEDIINILERLKGQAQFEIVVKEQLNYFKEKIFDYKLKNIDALKKSEFEKHFVEKNSEKGYITELIAQKFNQTNMISLRKLEVLIGYLEQMYEGNEKRELPQTKSFIRKSSVQIDIDKNNYIDYFFMYCEQNLKDQSILSTLEQFYQKLKNMQWEFKQQGKQFEKSEQFLKKQIEKKEDTILNYDKIIEEKQKEINQLEKNIELLSKENESLLYEKAGMIKYMQHIEQQKQKSYKEKKELEKKEIWIEQELQFYRSNFKQLQSQYWECLEKANTNLIQNEQKILKLQEEADQLKKKNTQMQNQFERGLDEIATNFESDTSLFTPQNSPKKYFDSPIYDISEAFSNSETNLGFLKHRFEEDKQIEESQLENQNHEYDEMGVLQTKQYEPIMNILSPECKKNEKNYKEQNKTNFYSSSGYFIEESGNQTSFEVIIVNGKIAFLDTKYRLNFIIGFEQIKKIMICYFNTSWVVIKAKQNQKNNKGLPIKDMVLSLANRPEFLEYLGKFKTYLEKQKIKVEVEKQQNIWLENKSKQCLLSGFNNCYNNYQLSFSNCKDMFDVSIKDNNSFLSFNSLFNYDSKRILMVTKLGLLIFDSNKPEDLEKKQNLFYLLPIVQKMEVIEFGNELKLSYEVEKKTYLIKAKSKALTHKLKKKIDEQKEENLREKKWELKRQQAYFK